ncbi:uncharacterized protein LOC144169849 [Haemaphysalis longicornis]
MPTPGGSDGDGGQLEWAIAGFRACAEEALRFLIEQERLPGNDPVVLGLWRHLALQELTMDVDSVLSQRAAEADSPLPEPQDEAPMSDSPTPEQVRVGPQPHNGTPDLSADPLDRTSTVDIDPPATTFASGRCTNTQD